MRHDLMPVVRLPFIPPLPWKGILGFLAGRAIPGVEMVRDGCYFRTASFRLADNQVCSGWLTVSHPEGQPWLALALSRSLAPALPQVRDGIRRLFDLDLDPAGPARTLEAMNACRPGLFVPGIRLPGCFTPFETATRAVLGQQVTVKAASTLAGRLVTLLGRPLAGTPEGLTHAFPEPLDLLALGESAQDQLGRLGIISARAQCILSIARGLHHGELSLTPQANPILEMDKLRAIRGIGGWTAQYIAMRTMGYADAFLDTDAGVKQALPGMNARELHRLSEAWRPWRSYAVMCLWNSL